MIRPLGWMGRVKRGGIGGMAVLDGEKNVRAANDVVDVVVQLTGGACGLVERRVMGSKKCEP